MAELKQRLKGLGKTHLTLFVVFRDRADLKFLAEWREWLMRGKVEEAER